MPSEKASHACSTAQNSKPSLIFLPLLVCDRTHPMKTELKLWLDTRLRSTERSQRRTAKILYRKFETCIPRNELRVHSPNSCTFMFLCAINIFLRSVCVFCYRKTGGPMVGNIHRLQTHECVNWDCGRAVPFLGIHTVNRNFFAVRANSLPLIYALHHVCLGGSDDEAGPGGRPLAPDGAQQVRQAGGGQQDLQVCGHQGCGSGSVWIHIYSGCYIQLGSRCSNSTHLLWKLLYRHFHKNYFLTCIDLSPKRTFLFIQEAVSCEIITFTTGAKDPGG